MHFVVVDAVVVDDAVAAVVVASLEVFCILHKLKASFGVPVVVASSLEVAGVVLNLVSVVYLVEKLDFAILVETWYYAS